MPSYVRTRAEFTVNSFTAADQTAPSVSTFADGGFIVVWVTNDPTQDGDGNAIKAQLFDAAGNKVGIEFLVNSDANGQQFTPRVATLDNGNFLVTWVTSDATNAIKAQLFDRSGDPIGGEFQVNAAGGSLFEANVTSLADGGFIISWDDWSSLSVKAQMFDDAGGRVGGVLTLAATTAQGFGDVVALADGGFVATWRVNGTSWDVKAQIFDASGGRVGGEFLVNTIVAGSQNAPAASALADGGFVITWAESNPEFQSGNTRIKAQLFTASGERVGGELLVSTTTAYTMGGQVVTALPDGGFLIAWHTTVLVAGGGSDSEVRAQRFTASGEKADGELLVNTLAAGSQWIPDLDTLADGRVIAVWASGSGDLGGQSVRAQILGTELAAPLPNTAPRIISNGAGTSASLSHDEGVTAVTIVVASDDGEPNDLRYSITGGADAALFTINALTGALAFLQPPDHDAPLDEGGDNFYVVTVSASDGEFSAAQSLEILVRHVNQVTIVSDGGDDYALIFVDENQTGVTTVSAVDDDGAPLSYAIEGGDDAALFTIDAQTGELSFAVGPDYEWPEDWDGDNVYLVYVSASDGTVTDTQGIEIVVGDVDDGGGGVVIVSDGGGDAAVVEMAENMAAVTAVTASSSGFDPVTYEIVGGADAWQFTIDADTGALEFVYAPDFDYPNDDDYDNVYKVTVRASDGLSFDEQHLSVAIGNVDEAPEFYSYWGADSVALTLAENGWQVGAVAAWDPDGYYTVPVTYAIAGGADAALFAVDPDTGALTFIHDARPDFEAPTDADGDNVYEVVVAANSGELGDLQAFAITIANENEGIFIVSDGGGASAAIAVSENERGVTTVVAFDPDGTTATYSIAGGADSGLFSIDAATGALRFVAAPDFEAPADADGDNVYTVVVAAGDGEFSTFQTLSVQIGNVNESVVFATDFLGVSIGENAVDAAIVAAADSEGAPLGYAIVGGPDASHFTIDAQTGALSFVAAPDYEAPADSDGDNVYSVLVEASDGVTTATQGVIVAVANRDEAPSIVSYGGEAAVSLSLSEGGVAAGQVAAVDEDGDAVAYAIVGGADASLFAIDAATGELRFLAAPDFEAPADADGDNVYRVEVAASATSFSVTQAFAIAVTNLNEAAAISSNGGGSSATLAVLENASEVTTVAAADPDGDTVSFAIAGGADAACFTIDTATGALQFVAAPNFEWPADADGDNVYEVVVAASDGELSDLQTLAVAVVNVRDGATIIGTPHNDSITGASTTLRTTGAEDTVYGGGGHDTIDGLGGDDRLFGEAGKDVLIGGAGSDRLSGGAAADDFVYNKASDSTAASLDFIVDFARSQGDCISLATIDANSAVSGNQAFTFIGSSAFSNSAGQLRYEIVNGTTYISGDVDGDGLADLQIQVSGSVAFVASDFIL